MRLLLVPMLVILMGMSFSEKTQAQTLGWPNHEQVRLVEIIVFRRTSSSAPLTSQEGMFEQSGAQWLAPSPARQQTASAFGSEPVLEANSISRGSNYLRWIEAMALSAQSASPYGPLKPIINPTPLLNYPLMDQTLNEPSIELNRAIKRLQSSPDFQVLASDSWHQVMTRSLRWVYLGDRCLTLPKHGYWRFEYFIERCSANKEILRGALGLSDGQFLRADLKMVWHNPVISQQGPLKNAFLSPTGYAVESLEENRAVRTGEWNYFDSAGLGVLLRLSALAVQD